jgi:hypothetical protein
VIPPEANPGFVAAMEDALGTYQRPRDPDRPLVCLDETFQAIGRRDARPDPGPGPDNLLVTTMNTSATASPISS